MHFSHFLLALLVVVVWGVNFLFVKLGLTEISPLLLCAIRFLLASVPIIFFIKPPTASFKIVALYGLVMFALQFSLVFMGIHAGMTAGMASLIMQVQVFFSMFFAALVLAERPSIWQIIGAIISFSGIALVATHFDQNISLLGFILILGASASWGVGNLITKKLNNVNIISLVAWGSFIACIPMFLLSLIFEGIPNITTSYENLTWKGLISIAYIVYASTWIGYGVWNFLLSRYPVSTVVPLTLLVPVVGMFSSALVMHEPLPLWKLGAAFLVMSGLCINLLGARFFASKKESTQTPMAISK